MFRPTDFQITCDASADGFLVARVVHLPTGVRREKVFGPGESFDEWRKTMIKGLKWEVYRLLDAAPDQYIADDRPAAWIRVTHVPTGVWREAELPPAARPHEVLETLTEEVSTELLSRRQGVSHVDGNRD